MKLSFDNDQAQLICHFGGIHVFASLIEVSDYGNTGAACSIFFPEHFFPDFVQELFVTISLNFVMISKTLCCRFSAFMMVLNIIIFRFVTLLVVTHFNVITY